MYFFDMRKNLVEECLSETVVDIMRPCLLAKMKKISCLPNFISFQRVRSEVRLTVSTFTTCFTDLLQDKEMIEINGNNII